MPQDWVSEIQTTSRVVERSTVARGLEGERESSVSLFALMANARWVTVVRNLDPGA